MSPLDQAIQRVVKRGWLIKALGRSEFNGADPWFCCVYPGHLGGRYYQGTKVRKGLYSHYQNSMICLTGAGADALQAVNDAIAKIDASKERHVYEALEQAFEDMLNAHRQTTGDSG
jgi:hypothetical protein